MNLYLRLFSLLLRLIGLKQKPLPEDSRVASRVLATDCDLNLHMNNGRYLAFMDLGRVHLMGQAGVLGRIMRQSWQPVLMAAEINFIRALKPLQRFELVTRVVTWDDKYAYLEQRFEAAGGLYAHAFLRTLFLQRGRKVPVARMIAAGDRRGCAADARRAQDLGRARRGKEAERVSRQAQASTRFRSSSPAPRPCRCRSPASVPAGAAFPRPGSPGWR